MRRPTLALLILAAAATVGCRQDSTLRGSASAASLDAALAAAPRSAGLDGRRIWTGYGADMSGSPSPDGRLISYADWTTPGVGVRDLQTGENRLLVRGSFDPQRVEFAEYSVFSPDGGRLAFAWFNGQEMDLRVVDVAGGEPRVVRADLGYIYPADWTPDGRELLVAVFGEGGTIQIGFMDVADGSFRVLRSDTWRDFPIWEGGQLGLSPDGRFVALNAPPRGSERARDIVILAADGSRESGAIRHPADDFFVGWTPDGRLLFGSDRGGATGLWAQRVRDGRPDGAPELLRAGMHGMMPMGLSADGRLFYGTYSGGWDVYEVAFDPADARLLSQPARASHRRVGFNQGIDWSPDGRHTAYLVRLGIVPRSRAMLAIRDEQSGAVRELHPELAYINAAIRWSPDGRSILAPAGDEKGRYGLFRIDALTGAAEALFTVDGVVHGPVWSPDGRSVFYFQREREIPPPDAASVAMRDLATGTVRILARGDDIGATAISDDGELLAFVRRTPGEGSRIFIQPVAGGDARERLHLPDLHINGMTWTRDRRHLLLLRGDMASQTRSLWSVPLDGGEPVALGLAEPSMAGLRVHPDGRRLGFTAGEGSPEVWVLDVTPAAGAGR
jgi:Tol biopolymer transport system component